MKKIFIISALLLSTGLTALSITANNNKTELKTYESDLSEASNKVAEAGVLATAD